MFNKNSVQMYEAGPDGRLATADDVRVAARIRYTTINERQPVRGPVAAGSGYRVKIVSCRIDVPGDFALDGEFNGTFPSGDGVASSRSRTSRPARPPCACTPMPARSCSSCAGTWSGTRARALQQCPATEQRRRQHSPRLGRE
jgi:hypothetical protein